MRLYYLITVFLLISSKLCAQYNTSSNYELNGLIVDDISGAPLPYVNIQLGNNTRGTTSTQRGRFKIRASKGEKFRLSAVNYSPIVISVPDSVFDLSITWIIRMKSKSYHLDEVTVEEEKSIPLAYKSDVFKEKPTIGHLLFQPISYFYYYFSHREKKKRDLLSIIEQEQLAEKYSNIIGKSQIAQLTGLKGKELEQCVIYCNSHIILTLQDTEHDKRETAKCHICLL